MGWGHRNTAIAEYLLMLLAGISALWAIGLDTPGQGYVLALWGVIYLGLTTWVDRRWRRHEAASKSVSDV
jgi:hypothetical protein